MGGGFESRCVGRVYGADGAVHGSYRVFFFFKFLPISTYGVQNVIARRLDQKIAPV